MKFITEIEDFYYSISRIISINGRLILYFHFGVIEVGKEDLETPEMFYELYFQVFRKSAPHFDSKEWDTFVEMLLDRAQEA